MNQTIDIQITEEMAAEIEKRASSANLSANTYIRLVLLDCLECRENGPLDSYST